MNKNLYSVRINRTGKYVKYCDDCWYETIDEELRVFSKDRAEQVVKQMRSHYVYDVTISNGTDTVRYDLKSGFIRKPQKVSVGENKKASIKKLLALMNKYKKKVSDVCEEIEKEN